MSSILVVDDDPAFYHIVEGMLTGEGLELHYVRDSTEVLEQLEQLQPKVILTDLMMPKKNGLDLCREIRSQPRFLRIPIILLTSLNDEHFMAQCLEAGADEFLSKEVSGCELRARVRSMLRIQQHYDDLQKAISLREDVAHMIVHDLGNPLGTIILEAEELLSGGALPEQMSSLEKISKNAHRLHTMTHDLLLLAKMEHGKLLLDPQPQLLSSTVKGVIDNLAAQARRRKTVVEFTPPAEETPTAYDGSLMVRIVENLLSNALKFSPGLSRLEIRLSDGTLLTGPSRRLEILDEGPGIAHELQDKIFEKFEVVKMSIETSQLGLGLAFCRMAIEAHGGKIGVTPNSPKGSIFWFEIPQ